MSNLFTYGSLMFPEVWRRVVTGNYSSQVSTLHGFMRKQVRGETYPVIIPRDEPSRLDGILYHGISSDDMARLDRFEGEYYVRMLVSAMTAAGDRDEAFVYVLKEEYRHVLSPDDWDADTFAKQGIRRFLADYGGFDR